MSTSTKDDIKVMISKLLALPGASSALKLNSDTVERAYEAYIWSLCKRAVEAAGGRADLCGINSGMDPRPVVLRGAPGNMSSTDQDYCYISCELGEKKFEIHLDVQYEGSSKAPHEIDISFYDQDSADMVRATGRLPKSAKLIAAIECKFYTAAPPSIAQGREFVGLLSDFTGTRMNAFVSNRAAKNLGKYFANKSRIDPFTDLTPDNPNTENMFICKIEHALLKWAQ